MTVSQAAFALFLLTCLPGFGLCGGLFCEHTRRRWYGGQLIAAAAAFFGLCVSGAIAAARHPHYPVEGPPEHTALLYLIPAFAIGVGVTRWLERYGSQHTDPEADVERVALNMRRGKRLLRGGTLLALLLILGIYNLFTWSFHRALPWGATNVREHIWSDGFLPDYSYQLKARITEAEFLEYVQAFEMRKVSSGSSAVKAASRQIATHGLLVGVRLLQFRFDACRWAHQRRQALTGNCSWSGCCNGSGTWNCG